MKWMISVAVGVALAFALTALGAPGRTAKPAKPQEPKDQKERVLVLKDGAPEAVRKWFDSLPVVRAEYVAGMERDAQRLETQIGRTEHRPLPKVRVGGNAFGGDELRPDQGAANARYRDVKNMKAQLAEERREIERVRADKVFVPSPEFKPTVGAYGTMAPVRVTQVIDGQNMLAELPGDKWVWIKGVPTKDVVDDQNLILSQSVICTGTKRYATAFGTRTVLMVEPLNYREWVEVKVIDPKDQDAARPKGYLPPTSPAPAQP